MYFNFGIWDPTAPCHVKELILEVNKRYGLSSNFFLAHIENTANTTKSIKNYYGDSYDVRNLTLKKS